MKGRDLRGKDAEKIFFEIFEEDNYKLTRSKLIKLFSRTKKGPPRYDGSDIISIGPEQYKDIKPNSTTTIGIFIFNKLLIEHMDGFGYINKVADKKLIGKVYDGIAYLLLEGILKPLPVFTFIDRFEYLFGGPLSHIINPSIDLSIMSLPPSTRKLKDKLFTDNFDELEDGNIVLMAQLEKQITDHAYEQMKKIDSPALAFYESGCGLDIYNHFKSTFISKGPVLDNTDPDGKRYRIVRSNYDDGISKEDVSANNDSFVTGAYAKGKGTGISGYSTKKYYSLYLDLTLDERGSDCGTKKYIEVLVTPENITDLGKYKYIMENGKPKLLTPKTVTSYLGKIVKRRSPGLCETKGTEYCNICYGDMPYRLDRTHVGATFPVIPNSRLNASMKKFHDSTIRLREIKLDELTKFMYLSK